MDIIHFLCVICLILVVNVDAIMFHLPPTGKKCLKEEIHKDVLVKGEYEISDNPAQKVNLKVNLFNVDNLFNNLFTLSSSIHGVRPILSKVVKLKHISLILACIR